MKRRALIKGAAAGATVAAWPHWIQRAFASTPSPAQNAMVVSAYRRAKQEGKPLLVLVIPNNERQSFIRGKLWGEFLTAGETADRAALMLTTVICARLESLQSIVPTLPSDDPFAVIVETDVESPELRSAGYQWPESELAPSDMTPAQGRDWRRDSGARALTARVQRLGAMVRALVVPDETVLGRRLEQMRRAAPADLLRRVEEALARDDLPADDADCARGAALLWAAAQHGRPMYFQSLKRLTDARLVRIDIPGGRWQVLGYPCPTCGMGDVSEQAKTFLQFLTEDR